MPLIVTNIKCPKGSVSTEIIDKARVILGIDRSVIASAGVYKISLDARKREDIHLVCSVMISLKSQSLEAKLSKRKDCRYFSECEPKIIKSTEKREGRTVISGFGPAGMFAALILSENGYRPIVLERGAMVQERVKAVERFFAGGELNPSANVQFGEGGAGTFSDGKLTTRIGDPLCRYVLKRLCEMGAPEEIMYEAKPHIGTDKLREIVKNIRERVIESGGEIRFLTKADGIRIKNGRVSSVITDGGDEIETASLTLAIGHSARDTFEMLLKNGVTLEPKAFSVGARIEHLQRDVDISLYGGESDELGLKKGEYQLSYRKPDGRGVYTFCMCPGGQVVAASSEPGGIVTNGMSEHSRSGKNANSALVVSVGRDDFPGGALGGVEFARSIERRAFSGSYEAPAMTVGEFTDELTVSKRSVEPTYRPGVRYEDLGKILPGFVCDMMREGIRKFSREMKCFNNKDAVLTAPETRTSSPVRITRTENGTALGFDNLYPCGEGAGYAGGIMSAAVDGIKTALKIIEAYSDQTE